MNPVLFNSRSFKPSLPTPTFYSSRVLAVHYLIATTRKLYIACRKYFAQSWFFIVLLVGSVISLSHSLQ
jgi:hypothetical protein